MSGRHRDPGPLTRAVLVVGLVAVVAFWALLLVSDDAVSPFAFAGPVDDAFVALAIVHVVSAPVAWVAALRVTVRHARPGWTVFGAAVVPAAAVVSLLVLMTDAVVWRDDLGAWVLAMGLALLGPGTLVVSLATALRMTRDGTPG